MTAPRLLAGCAALLGLAAAAAPSPAVTTLPRTREVLKSIGLSFVGQPTLGELLMGGLAAVTRVSPGLMATMDKDGVVTVKEGRRTLSFKTEEMISDTEVAAALERSLHLHPPALGPTAVDDQVASSAVTALADRHSAYLRPELVERLGYSADEELGDPGLDVVQQGSRVVVHGVAAGSAAAAAHVVPGMVVKRVDSHNVDGISLGEVGALLLGRAGTSMELTLEPKGGGEPVTVKLPRDPPYALSPRISVQRDALVVVPGPLLGHAWLAVEDALKKRPANVKAVILDFRGNGGGQVGDAVNLADLFVPAGPVAVVMGRANRPVQRFEAKSGNVGEALPVVMLVDGRTASASELTALILRERLHAVLVGEQTYGKGSVQKLLPIAGGGILKITSAMYSTAAGTTVGDGIMPDVLMDAALFPPRGKEGVLASDPWLQAAYEQVIPKAAGEAPHK